MISLSLPWYEMCLQNALILYQIPIIHAAWTKEELIRTKYNEESWNLIIEKRKKWSKENTFFKLWRKISIGLEGFCLTRLCYDLLTECFFWYVTYLNLVIFYTSLQVAYILYITYIKTVSYSSKETEKDFCRFHYDLEKLFFLSLKVGR